MSITCLSQIALSYMDSRSDKLYIIQVQQEETTAGTVYKTVGYYGRRGASLSVATKYTGASLPSANAAATKMEREKRGKGYGTWSIPAAGIPGMPAGAPKLGAAPTGGTPASSATPAPAAKAIVGQLPMLAEAIDEDSLEFYLTSPDWAAQRKYDGERGVVSMRRSGFQPTNRKGELRAITQAVNDALSRFLSQPDFSDERETVVDGELMGDVYVIYDVLTLRDNDVRKQSYAERFASLEMLLDTDLGMLAETAWTEEEKRALLDRARKEAWEGIIFRQIDGKYVNGRTKVLLKFKLWASATCRVLTVNTQRSVQLAVVDDDGVERFVGNVTIPVNHDIPEPDDLVEVRYLYLGEGGSLYQPIYLGVRADKDDADTRSSLRKAPPEKRAEAPSASAEVAEAI